jgi:hypothetical protein
VLVLAAWEQLTHRAPGPGIIDKLCVAHPVQLFEMNPVPSGKPPINTAIWYCRLNRLDAGNFEHLVDITGWPQSNGPSQPADLNTLAPGARMAMRCEPLSQFFRRRVGCHTHS